MSKEANTTSKTVRLQLRVPLEQIVTDGGTYIAYFQSLL